MTSAKYPFKITTVFLNKECYEYYKSLPRGKKFPFVREAIEVAVKKSKQKIDRAEPDGCHYYEQKTEDFENCPVTLHAANKLTLHCLGCKYNPFDETATKQLINSRTIHSNKLNS